MNILTDNKIGPVSLETGPLLYSFTMTMAAENPDMLPANSLPALRMCMSDILFSDNPHHCPASDAHPLPRLSARNTADPAD